MNDPLIIEYEFFVPETGYVTYEYVLDSMDIDTIVEEWGEKYNEEKGTAYDMDTLYDSVGDILDEYYDEIKEYLEGYAKDRWSF